MSNMSDIHFEMTDLKKPVRKKSVGKDPIPYHNMSTIDHPHDDHLVPDHHMPESGRTDSFASLVTDAMSNTGMQGLPNVQRSRSIFRKVFWTIICFAGIVVMSWQISLAVIKYYTYPTSTTLEYQFKNSLQFPAVTICNNNPVKQSRLQSIGSNSAAAPLAQFVQQTHTDWEGEVHNHTVSNVSSPQGDWYTDPSQYDYQYASDPAGTAADQGSNNNNNNAAPTYQDVMYEGAADANFNFVEDFITRTSMLSREDRTRLGHQLNTMLISCTWQGKKCRMRQFASFNNYMYGNCYTFNSGRLVNGTKPRLLKTDKIGPLYGFSVELYIEQDEYINGLADGAGVRLIIHNQTDMPFPEDYGISLQPGSKTSIGITRKDMRRVPAPHGKCVDYSWEENKARNAFLDDIDTVNYTVNACRKTCFQRALIQECLCYDYKVPVSEQLEAYQDIAQKVNISDLKPCKEAAVFARQEPCIKNVTTAFLNNKLACNTRCHTPCFEADYPYTASYSQWPSTASETRVLNVLSMKNRYFWNLVQSSSYDSVWKKQWMNDNMLKVEVYFQDLNYEVIKIAASYDAINLISDLGGQAGLWLGVSVIAFFELFELVLDISILTVKYFSQKRGKVNNSDKPQLLDSDRPRSKLAFGPGDPIPVKPLSKNSSPQLEAKIAVDDM